MRITEVEAIVLETPAHDRRAADQTHEAVLICVTTETGVVGVGEAAASPRVVRAFIEERTSFAWSQGVIDLLSDADPRDPRQVWRTLYDGTIWPGRIGLGHIALAGVDMALWDLAGKLAGQPVWKLLGTDDAQPVFPYLTVYTGPNTLAATIDLVKRMLDQAIEGGYRAAKIEAMEDTTSDQREIADLMRAARAHVGDEMMLGLDVGYRWNTADEALRCVRQLEDLDVLFIETPFPPELVDEYRKLIEASPIRIAGAEILTAISEYAPLIDAGLSIAQAGTCRIGITESHRLAQLLHGEGKSFIPYGYVSTLFPVLANIHVAAANPNVPLVEYAPPNVYEHMILRRELAAQEPLMRDGRVELPLSPGLGAELDKEAVARFRVA